MATIQEQIRKLRKLTPEKLELALFKCLKSIENDLIDLNTKDQLLKGENAEGNPIFSNQRNRGTYSLYTELITKGRKQEGDPYTLFDTGDFFKGFYVNIEGDSVRFGSTDPKSFYLILEYDSIFGLTDENLKGVIREKLLPFLQQHIRKTLDL